MSETLQLRIHGEASRPTLVYLPGTHGDWTLIGNFRRALGGRLRFVEITYPRTLTWSLEEHAAAVETALREHGIQRGWLLGESFGSQVAWPIAARGIFEVDGIILAGGFVRHPARWVARFARGVIGAMPLSWFKASLNFYARIIRIKFRRSSETRDEIRNFIERRTELDRQAIRHRLRLIIENDFRSAAKNVSVPMYALTGAFDPTVPWLPVRSWLRKNCPALRDYRVIWRAEHNVLSTAAQRSADQVVKWMTSK